MDALQPYEYLRLERGQIRIMHVAPSNSLEAPLRCSLHTISLPAAGEVVPYDEYYITLSYVWGDTHPDGSHLTHSLICDGHQVRITAGLHQTLKRIRQKLDLGELQVQGIVASIRPGLWVDYICINQLDLTERCQQVEQMATIYERSTRLIIRLGELSEADAAFMKASLHGNFKNESEPARAKASELFRHLVQRPWFERRWTVQEYCKTSKYARYFLIRDSIINDWTFLDTLRDLARESPAGPLDYVGSLGGDYTKSILIEDLHRYGDTKCSNVYDIVYALMQMSVDGVNLKVDYERPVEAVFYTAAEASIIYDARCIITALACATARPFATRDRSKLTMPCWVPDWRALPIYAALEHSKALDALCSPSIGFGCLEGEGYSLPCLRDDDGVVLTGRILQPCFPPRHRAGKSCFTCTMFAQPWATTLARRVPPMKWGKISDELKEFLSRLSRQNAVLFVPAGTTPFYTFFPLSPYQAEGRSETLYRPMGCCFVAHANRPRFGSNILELEMSSDQIKSICAPESLCTICVK
ncbi:hypothetical protein LTR37_012105 [Vermiconidia calcicola]|uniref:Uncharacterized protein n=1 Tax=Vermiconidia calcicola TaxID=1690605 RepID=A0ACC3N037_9PEZI|nr:hypothetical protein LTR37_012105 [Vermiconidia calcicola]